LEKVHNGTRSEFVGNDDNEKDDADERVRNRAGLRKMTVEELNNVYDNIECGMIVLQKRVLKLTQNEETNRIDRLNVMGVSGVIRDVRRKSVTAAVIRYGVAAVPEAAQVRSGSKASGSNFKRTPWASTASGSRAVRFV